MGPKKDEEEDERYEKIKDEWTHCPNCGQRYRVEDGHDCVAVEIDGEEE